MLTDDQRLRLEDLAAMNAAQKVANRAAAQAAQARSDADRGRTPTKPKKPKKPETPGVSYADEQVESKPVAELTAHDVVQHVVQHVGPHLIQHTLNHVMATAAHHAADHAAMHASMQGIHHPPKKTIRQHLHHMAMKGVVRTAKILSKKRKKQTGA